MQGKTNYKLNSLIYGKYKNQAQMSDAMGWPRGRLNKIVNGLKEPDLDEVNEIAKALDVTLSDIANIFLASSHQTGNK